jgi:hypothetical protein
MNEKISRTEDPHPETFKWIFQPPKEMKYRWSRSDRRPVIPWDDFPGWLRSDSKLYWICGKAGSGKSTMMKYLVETLTDNDMLSTASAGKPPILLSHFFQLEGGNVFQRDKVGLLSNLLHQVLEDNLEICDSIFAKFPATTKKLELTDWSDGQLKNVLFDVLQNLHKSICIFIDGLDEICLTVGAHDLLNFLQDLSSISDCKLCVSSRPERAFVQALGSSPQLKLHHLTEGDIAKLAMDEFGPLKDKMPTTSRPVSQYYHVEWEFDYFIDTFVDKAEGVFLWAHLASRSIHRGLINGDTWETLLERLENLPSDLNKLYMGMWSRLGDDQDLYKVKAASFFNIVLAAEDIDSGFAWYNRSHEVKGLGTLLDFAFADKEIELDKILNVSLGEGALDFDTILDKCQEVFRAISVYSAGLLEVRKDNKDPRGVARETCGLSCSHSDTEPDLLVRFIHRTARDFFLDTAEGQQLLSCDKTPRNEYQFRIIASTVARCRDAHPIIKHAHFPPMSMNAEDVLKRLYNPRLGIPLPQQSSLTDAIEKLYESHQLRWEDNLQLDSVLPTSHSCSWSCNPHRLTRPDFLGILCQLQRYPGQALDRITVLMDSDQERKSYFTYLLRALLYTCTPSDTSNAELKSLLLKHIDGDMFLLTPYKWDSYARAALKSQRIYGAYVNFFIQFVLPFLGAISILLASCQT